MAPPSALHAPADALLPWMGGAAVGHVVLVAVFIGLNALLDTPPPEPLFELDNVIEVALMPMPKSETALPTRATRQAAPRAAETPPEPEAPPEPPPPRESEMVVKTPDAKPTPKPAAAVPKDSTRREAPNPQLKMDDLLAELADADVGPKDREASSPDGVKGAAPSRTVGAGSSDPELRAYISQLQQLFMKEFRPLPAYRGQGLKATVFVWVEDDGKVTKAAIDKSSGNASYDQSALTAAEAVPVVPLPPPAYRDGTSRNYKIVFSD